MNAPLLMFRPVDTSAPQFSAEFFALCGVRAGEQFPGCEQHQRLVWEDDTAAEIVAAFDAYVADNELSPDNAPRVRTACNTDEATIVENVRSACRRGLASVAAASAHDGHAVLVGGGPSLASTLGEIKRRKADGQTIFALNGAGNWLAEHGVHPDHIVMLDPRPGNARFVGLPTCYLLASQCAPEVFDAALASKGAVLMWHFADPAIADVVEVEAPGSWGCTGTLTVGLTAMMLVHCMGYRKIHLYGYDSSDADGEGHAYAQAETTAEAKRIAVMCSGRKFSASAPMYAQVCAFEWVANALKERGAIITVHGDGLLPTYARSMNPIQESLAA